MSIGMNAQSGTFLSEHNHLRQSIAQILTTPIGSRVMRRSFGSLLPELLDHPLNEQTVLQLYAATATALLLHEPRLRLVKVDLTMLAKQGQSTLTISGITNFGGTQQFTDLSIPINTAGMS